MQNRRKISYTKIKLHNSCRQLELDLHPQGKFNHPNICWKNNISGHKQSRRFLERLIGNVKAKGNLGYSDHEMAEFRGAKSKMTILNYRRAVLASSGICLEESHGIMPWREGEPKKTD